MSEPQATNKHVPAALVAAIMKAVAPHIFELEQKVDALSARVAELEASSLKYMGVYQTSGSYPRGSVGTQDGSAWHATRAVTAERPGASDGWQLMVKHGKDAAGPRSETATANARVNGHYSRPRSP